MATHERSLSPDAVEAVLQALLQQLDSYVFTDVAQRVQADIRQRLADGGYVDIKGGQQLADILTAQLQDLAEDRALRLHYSPAPLPHLDPNATLTADELAQQQAMGRRRSYDINRVERLAGNVGYVQLFGFEPPEFAGDALAAALTLVAHTDALILDLRHNQGGSAAMVALLCSYLLPPYPAVHLNDLYWAAEDRTQQWWTMPHLAGPRYLDRPVFVLTSPETFSAAEECAYNLQTLQRATIVGETTRGGANPGRGFRLHDHFWVFMPTGRAINPITQANWEGTGVRPEVKVPTEVALETAHLIALTQSLEGDPVPSLRQELEAARAQVERILNQKRQDLISQLGGQR